MEHPNFFARKTLLSREERELAEEDARSPTSRPTCQAAECAVMLRRDARVIQHLKGGILDGEESSQGRKEEGSEEEVASLLRRL